MKNEFLFWMAMLPSCKVVVTGLVVELIIYMPLQRSDMRMAIGDRHHAINLSFCSNTNLK